MTGISKLVAGSVKKKHNDEDNRQSMSMQHLHENDNSHSYDDESY